jgi:hypothetical protein
MSFSKVSPSSPLFTRSVKQYAARTLSKEYADEEINTKPPQ